VAVMQLHAETNTKLQRPTLYCNYLWTSQHSIQ